MLSCTLTHSGRTALRQAGLRADGQGGSRCGPSTQGEAGEDWSNWSDEIEGAGADSDPREAWRLGPPCVGNFPAAHRGPGSVPRTSTCYLVERGKGRDAAAGEWFQKGSPKVESSQSWKSQRGRPLDLGPQHVSLGHAGAGKQRRSQPWGPWCWIHIPAPPARGPRTFRWDHCPAKAQRGEPAACSRDVHRSHLVPGSGQIAGALRWGSQSGGDHGTEISGEVLNTSPSSCPPLPPWVTVNVTVFSTDDHNHTIQDRGAPLPSSQLWRSLALRGQGVNHRCWCLVHVPRAFFKTMLFFLSIIRPKNFSVKPAWFSRACRIFWDLKSRLEAIIND